MIVLHRPYRISAGGGRRGALVAGLCEDACMHAFRRERRARGRAGAARAQILTPSAEHAPTAPAADAARREAPWLRVTASQRTA
jgi:hypothetical protein